MSEYKGMTQAQLKTSIKEVNALMKRVSALGAASHDRDAGMPESSLLFALESAYDALAQIQSRIGREQV